MCLIIYEENNVLLEPKIAVAQISKLEIELVGMGTKVDRWDVKIGFALKAKYSCQKDTQ